MPYAITIKDDGSISLEFEKAKAICRSSKGKITKQKKAAALKLKGNDIEIIPENVFYNMIEE